MNHRLLRVVSLYSLSFSLASIPLAAQSPESGAPRAKVEFAVYPVGSGGWDDVYYQAAPGVFEPLSFWAFERSPAHEFEGVLPIQFYREDRDEEGNPSYQAVATAPTVQGSDRLLFFFLPRNEGSGDASRGFQVVAMDDRLSRFPLNTITFFNATGATLEGTLGNEPLYLQRGISAPYRLDDDWEDEIFVGLAVRFEGGVRKVLQNRWRFYPDYREIIILMPPRIPGSFRIEAFRLTQHAEEIRPQDSLPDTSGR